MRKLLSLLSMLMLCCVFAFGQTHPVTGKVTDNQGNAVPYATVTEAGSSNATQADANGNFSISVRRNARLSVTAAGFQTQILEATGNTLSFNLVRGEGQLQEVTVTTALGLRRNRNTLPYAAQQISGDEANKTVTTNFVDNLSGKVAGLQITAANTMGGSTNAILRGMKSLTQSNQALFVVDGVPFDNTNQSRGGFDLGNAASDINPDDIESISVLKGAAASALYGSRASNGVILITTKKGNRRRGFGVTASFGITVGSPDPSTLPTYQTQYGQGYGSAGNDPGNPNLPDFFYYTSIPGSNGPVKIVQTNNDAATGPAYDPTLMVYNWNAFTPGDPNYGKATPWMPAAHHNPTDFFVTPVTTSTSVFAESGGDKGTFKLGYTHDDNKDYFPNSSLTKNLVSLTATHDITDKVTVGGNFNYSDNSAIGRYLYPYNGLTNIMTDFRQWWPTNVDIQQQKADYFNTLTNATWNWQTSAYKTNALGHIGLPAYHDNMYYSQYQNYEQDSRTRYFGNVNANYKITSSLNLMGRVSRDNYDQMVETRQSVGSQTPSSYYRYNQSYSETNYDLLLNFDKNITNSFNLKALLGSNIRKVNNQSIAAQTNGGLVVPGLYALSNSVKTPLAPTEVYQKKEVDGVFAGATLSYKEMITLDGTIRRDQSSTLPKSNNAYYYPSVSANFVFSKLLPGTTNWLSYGKVWGNYASVGGDAPYYSLQNTFSAGTPFNSQTVFGAPGTNNNPNLQPEKNNTYEIGLEASFLRSRLGFTVDYYHSQQVNQIMPASVSTASGFNTFYVNAGTVQNAGVELMVNVTPVRTQNFSWNMYINWSKNVSKVLFLYNNQPAYIIAKLQNSIQLVAETGNSYGIIRGTDYKYLNGQRVIDANGFYEIASNKLSDIGNMNPDWIGGINNSFSYKNVSLSFLIDVRQGGQLYSLDMDYGSFSGLYPRTAGANDLGNPVRSPLTNDSKSGGIILKGVTEDGKPNTKRIDESDVNGINGAYSFGSLSNGEANREFVYDASYVKLREVALTYSLPKKTLEKISFIRGIDFSLSGRNLWIIHKNLPYADPEQGQASGNASMGFQNGAYPSIRTIAAIVKIRF